MPVEAPVRQVPTQTEGLAPQKDAPVGTESKTSGPEKKFKFARTVDAGIAMLGLFSLLKAKAEKVTTTDKGPSQEDLAKAVQKSPVIGIGDAVALLRINEKNVPFPQYEIESFELKDDKEKTVGVVRIKQLDEERQVKLDYLIGPSGELLARTKELNQNDENPEFLLSDYSEVKEVDGKVDGIITDMLSFTSRNDWAQVA